VPGDFTTEAVRMLAAGAIVAAAAVPLGLVGWALGGAGRSLALPAWDPWRVPWSGFEVFAAFLLLAFTIPLAVAQSQLPALAVGVVALPIQLAFLAASARFLYPKWPIPWANPFAALPVAVAVWAVLTPAVLLFHAGIVQLFTAAGLKPDEHPLAKFTGGDEFTRLLFLLQACLAAPLIEEVLFRGVLLPWVIGSRRRWPAAESPPVTPAALRPWLVVGFAVAVAALSGKVGPTVFAAVLAGGLGVVWVTVRRGKRHVRAVYATAAMFAAIHSSVWPSPVPLFLLGLGLGWCAVRTRGVIVPAVVHGLFNAVSAVYVLRGGAG
jgi:membrane protease YdiL (CAAX protease family)